jgi:hypothetical protein
MYHVELKFKLWFEMKQKHLIAMFMIGPKLLLLVNNVSLGNRSLA